MAMKKLAVIFLISTFLCAINAQCNSCDPITNLACFSDSQYFKCNSKGEIAVNSIMRCPPHTICDHALGGMPCSNTSIPTCPRDFIPVVTSCSLPNIESTTTPPTLPANTGDANEICASMPVGRFPHGTNCTQYVYCYMSQSTKAMKGTLITCPVSTLFDPSTGDCKLRYTCPEVSATTPTSEPSKSVVPDQRELLDLLLMTHGSRNYSVVVKPID